jgi:hypothetical protein
MRRFGTMLLLLVVLLTLGGADPTVELERNRVLLEKWRADPEHWQRLQHDLQAFYALPESRQKAMRRFDRQLHEGDLAVQARRWRVLGRYASWLEKLPAEERRRIDEETNPAKRLQLLRELRSREWLDRLPDRLRNEVLRLPAEQRAERIAQLRAEERRQRQNWQRLSSSRSEEPVPRPAHLNELPTEVRQFVELAVLPRLSADERDRLRKAEGKYPEWLRLIHDLNAAHPVLPPLPSGPIVSPKDLPIGMRRLTRMEIESLRSTVGRWPEFALEVTRQLRGKVPNLPSLGASKLDDFPPEIQTVVRNQLLPRLNDSQRQILQALQGRWPEYPLELLRLAQQKRVILPVMGLPGPPAMWEAVRATSGGS